jgi:hypothetical protein
VAAASPSESGVMAAYAGSDEACAHIGELLEIVARNFELKLWVVVAWTRCYFETLGFTDGGRLAGVFIGVTFPCTGKGLLNIKLNLNEAYYLDRKASCVNR